MWHISYTPLHGTLCVSTLSVCYIFHYDRPNMKVSSDFEPKPCPICRKTQCPIHRMTPHPVRRITLCPVRQIAPCFLCQMTLCPLCQVTLCQIVLCLICQMALCPLCRIPLFPERQITPWPLSCSWMTLCPYTGLHCTAFLFLLLRSHNGSCRS